MMAPLMDALTGSYWPLLRLVIVMVTRHFLSEDQLFRPPQLDANLDKESARAD